MEPTPRKSEIVAAPVPGAPWLDHLAYPETYDGVTMRRLLAYLVDLLVIAPAVAVVAVIFWTLGVLTFGLLTPLLGVMLIAVPFCYHTLLIGGTRSATLGMRLFGLQVRRLDGGRPDHVLAALLTAAFYISVAFTGWLIMLVVLFNVRGRALHDFLCGTVVINTPGR
jgi:uncharacterized RDD family membrane protein YckC